MIRSMPIVALTLRSLVDRRRFWLMVLLVLAWGAAVVPDSAQFSALVADAALPGFRPGRAPRRLVEKRFGSAVAGEAKNQLIASAFSQAIEEHKITVLGDPEGNEELAKLKNNTSAISVKMGAMLRSCSARNRLSSNLRGAAPSVAVMCRPSPIPLSGRCQQVGLFDMSR